MEVTVDIGKSGSRIRLRPGPADAVSSGVLTGDTEGPGIDPSVAGRPDGARRVRAVIGDAIGSALSTASCADRSVSSVLIASTAVPADAGHVVSSLGDRFPGARIAMFTDHTVAHAAVLGAPGVVATVGTGVGVTALSGAGAIIRVDGWGPDLGDRGSAWQIGRDGLRAGFAARDGVGPATALEDAAEAFCGGMELTDAVRLLAADDRVARIAGFARAVCSLDDPVARSIVASAAADLVVGVSAAARRSGTATVAFRGRLMLDSGFRGLVEEGCRRQGWELRRPRGDVLDVDHGLLFTEPYRQHALALSE